MGFDLFGSQARSDVRKANKQATAALETGYGQQSQYYDQSAGLYDPYVSEGRDASEMYNALMGLRGGDAATGAYDTLADLPIFQGQLASKSNAVLKNLNARGMGGGGTAAMAGQRVLNETVGNWLDRYRDAGRDGYAATGAKAGITTARGDNAMGFGATKANQAVQYGNALASTRNAGLNNLLAIAGTAANAYGTVMGVPKPPAR